MQVINEHRFVELCQIGDIRHEACCYLDGLKIGLSIEPTVMKLPARICPAGDTMPSLDEVDLTRNGIESDGVFLARTRERISLSERIFGMLHTRSRWARLGLDCLGSSHYVAPGFGGGKPQSLILEIRAHAAISEFPLSEALAGLVLFELDAPVRAGSGAEMHLLTLSRYR